MNNSINPLRSTALNSSLLCYSAFPSISDWASLSCSLPSRTDPATATQPLVLPLSAVQPSEFICEYQTHCFALCMCCDFFACDCRMKCSDGCD